MKARLEPQFQGELNQARIVHGIVDDPECARSIDVLLAAASGATHVELRMVEQVEELGPELQVHAFVEGQREVLNDREIRVDEARTVHWGSSSRAKFSKRSLGKSARVEPVLNRVDSRGRHATGIARHRTWFRGIAHLVWTLVSAAVIGEEHS